MTLKRKKYETGYSEEEPDVETSGIRLPFKNALFFLLFLAGAMLVFGMLVVRTAGFREIAAVKNEGWTQTRVGIQGSYIGWPYDIVLTGVTIPVKPDGKKEALLIPEVRIGWRPGRGLVIRLIRPYVRLIQTEPEFYKPEELARMGDIRKAADVSDWLAPLNGRATLAIEQASLEILAPSGDSVRQLDGIGLTVTPVALPNRNAVHFNLRAGPLKGPGGGYLTLEQEWLSCGSSNVAEIAFAVEGASQSWGRDYWKGVQP